MHGRLQLRLTNCIIIARCHWVCTTSTVFNKGIVKISKLFVNCLDFNSLAAVFKSKNCSIKAILK